MVGGHRSLDSEVLIGLTLAGPGGESRSGPQLLPAATGCANDRACPAESGQELLRPSPARLPISAYDFPDSHHARGRPRPHLDPRVRYPFHRGRRTSPAAACGPDSSRTRAPEANQSETLIPISRTIRRKPGRRHAEGGAIRAFLIMRLILPMLDQRPAMAHGDDYDKTRHNPEDGHAAMSTLET